jgi:hypothetical protein
LADGRLLGYVRDNVLGFIAIFIALSAGAYAVQRAPKNSVVSRSIVNGQVKRADLAPNAVGSSKVLDDSLTGADINESTLTLPGDGNSGGTVTSITAGRGLEGGTITQQGTVALHVCPASQVLKSTGDDYACAPDADTDTNTTYSGDAVRGVALDGTAFGLKSCPDGQLLKSAGAGAYGCAADVDTNTTYTGDATRGVDLSGTSFGLKSCPAGQLLKSGPVGTYNCAADTDTNTTYSAGTGLQLAGTQFSIPNGGVGGAQIADDSITAADLGFVKSVDLDPKAVGPATCVGATVSQTLQFAPGQEGDYTLVTAFPALPRGFVLSGTVSGDVGGFREYRFNLCNLTQGLINLPAETVKMLVISQ